MKRPSHSEWQKNSVYTDKECIKSQGRSPDVNMQEPVQPIQMETSSKCQNILKWHETIHIKSACFSVSVCSVTGSQRWIILPWVTTLPNTGMVSRVEQFHRRLRNWNWHSSIASWAPRRTASITSTLRLQIWTWSRDTQELRQLQTHTDKIQQNT